MRDSKTANINVQQDVGVNQLRLWLNSLSSKRQRWNKCQGFRKRRKVKGERAVNTTLTRTQVTWTQVLGPATIANIIFTHPKIMIMSNLN